MKVLITSTKSNLMLISNLIRTLILICLSVLIFTGCEKKAVPVFDRPPAPVEVATAVSRDVPVYFDQVGKCVAREVVSIQPQIPGAITQIHFTDGAEVKAEDLLFTIDPRPFQAELQRAEANLAKDIALKKQAEANLAKDIAQAKTGQVQAQRYAELTEKGIISREQFDQVRTNAEALDAAANADRAAVQSAIEAIEMDKATIETAKVQLSYCYIRSPINGRVGQRLVDIGNIVSPANNTPLLVIQRLDPIYIDFTITQSDLSAVQHNMAQGKLKVEVRIPDEPDQPRSGELIFLDNAVQNETGTVKLRATISNADRHFWPGRFVNIRLILDTLKEAVLASATAPQMSAKGAFVYVVKDDATAELRLVTLGQKHGDLVVISQGLKSGERVITNGQLAVTPGGKVQVEETPSVGVSQTTTGGKL